MADQNAAADQAAEPVDSSVQETGTQEATTPSVNWEERAKEHQSWGTRLAQENAELKAQAELAQQLKSDDPAEQRKALEALGYTVPEDEEEDSQVSEPDPRLRQELDELRQRLDTRSETEQREQNYTAYRQEFDPKLSELGVPEAFLQNVADIAYNQLDAIQTPQGPQPDLEGAVKWFKEVAEMFADVPEVQSKVRKSWANTKPRSAFTSAGGGEGTQVLDMDKHENRVAHYLARLQDNQQQ
jgi:hypothetical protein